MKVATANEYFPQLHVSRRGHHVNWNRSNTALHKRLVSAHIQGVSKLTLEKKAIITFNDSNKIQKTFV